MTQASPQSTNSPRLMAIFAHPDDETFGVGGIFARATAAGHPCAEVSATRGEEGEIAAGSGATRDNLGQVREQELRNACAILGVTDVTFLDYIDGHLAEADEDEAVSRIVAQLRRFRPDVVVTFAANGLYGHPDHMAVHRLALAAIPASADPARYPDQIAGGLAPHRVRKVYLQTVPRERLLQMIEAARREGHDFVPGGNAATIPVEEMGSPEAEITTVITLTDEELSRKQQAMQAHVTQISPDNPFARASVEELRQMMGFESFILLPSPYSDRAYPTPEDDLFAGL
ncbi:MAG TPA: PIG-L family deacetylase [Ktedonobacterales bacterium]|nr:PIG-L family deacetylase [Ktedonobacterales bacterium]